MATARRESCWPVSDLNWPSAQPGVGPRDEETVGPLRAPGTQPWEHPSPLGTQALHGVADGQQHRFAAVVLVVQIAQSCCSCRSITSNSATLWTAARRLPCPSLSPGVCSNSRPSVGDAIQPSHPLSFPSPPASSLSQHQSLCQ